MLVDSLVHMMHMPICLYAWYESCSQIKTRSGQLRGERSHRSERTHVRQPIRDVGAVNMSI